MSCLFHSATDRWMIVNMSTADAATQLECEDNVAYGVGSGVRGAQLQVHTTVDYFSYCCHQ